MLRAACMRIILRLGGGILKVLIDWRCARVVDRPE
jgi:hypothetical protein